MAALALVGGGATLAADSTSIGGTIYTPASTIIEANPSPLLVGVTSRATGGLMVAVTLSVDGTGYNLSRSDLGVLAPGETATATFTQIGPGPATVTAHLVAADPPGVAVGDQLAIALALSLRHRTPLESALAMANLGAAVFGLVAAVLGLLLLLWRRGKLVWR